MIARLAAKIILVSFVLSMPIASAIAVALGATGALYAFYSYIVPRYDGEIVVSNIALAPFTSLIDLASLAHRLENISGIHIAPEVMVVALVEKHVVIVRGVETEATRYRGIDLSKLGNCLYCCIVGRDLAKRLGIELGRIVVVSSVFQRVAIPLKVVGYTDREPYSYEIIVPIAIARVLRCASRSHASVAYIHAEHRESIELLSRKLGIGVPRTLLERALIAIKYMGREERAKLYSSVSEVYLSRLGIDRTTVIAANLALSAIVAMGLYLMGRSLPHIAKKEIVVLRIVGMPRLSIATALCTALLVSMVLSWLCIYTALSVAKPRISIANHEIPLEIDIHVYALSLAIAYAIAVLGLARSGELDA